MPIGEAGADGLFDRVGREVSDDDQRGFRGDVFARPEGLERFGGGGVERLDRADGQAFGISGLRIEEGELVFEIGALPALPVSQFGQDDAAFARDGFGRDGEFAGGFAPLKAMCSVKWAKPRSVSRSSSEPVATSIRTCAVPAGVALRRMM